MNIKAHPERSVILLLLLGFFGWAVAGENGVTGRLRDAEAALLLAEGVHARVEAQYREMEKDPGAEREKILALEQYVHELGELLSLRRQTLEDLRKIAGVDIPEADSTVEEGMEAFASEIAKVPDTAEAETERDRLEREFSESLENFDGMILAHNQKLEERMDARIARGEAAAGKQMSAVEEAEALLKSMGVEGGSETAAGAGEPAGTDDDVAATDTADRTSETGEEGAADPGRTAASTDSGAQSGGSGTGGAGADRAPRGDEDIVARQLREAAEKEKDPVLREKLWKEYEAYLDGRS